MVDEGAMLGASGRMERKGERRVRGGESLEVFAW